MKILIGRIFNDCSMREICKERNLTLNDLSFLRVEVGLDIRVKAPWNRYEYKLKAEVCCCDNEGYPL